MKHQPFEEWIIMDEALDQEQQRQLHCHLKECSRCQALYQATHQIAHLFKTSPVPGPAEGFSERWKTRMRKIDTRRKILIFSGTTVVIAAALILLLVVIGFQFSAYISSFPKMLMAFIYQFSRWIVFITQLWDVLDPLLGVSVKMISPLWLLTFGFCLSGVFAAWMVSVLRSRSIQKELLQ